MTTNDAIPRRAYQGEVTISTVGFGGIILCGLDQQEANAAVLEAVERGVDYFDVAPTYGNGEAEEKLGPALNPHRDRAFLACKTTRRDGAGAVEELERSLRRLETDRFDLYQFHGIASMDDVDRILAPGGAAEAVLKARDEGKTRFVGFSAHSQPAAIRLMDELDLDSALFPINFVCFAEGGFGPAIIEHARARGVARLSLKSMALTRWGEDERRTWAKCWYKPVPDAERAKRAVRFALSQDITAVVPPGHLELFRLALEAAAEFKPMSEAEQAEMLEGAGGVEPIFRA